MRSSGPAPDLDVYDIAYLADGSDRVIDTALVALVQTGRVRIHSPGELAVAAPRRRHPVEAAVLDAVGPSGHRSVDTIRWRLTDDDRLRQVARRLQHDGLLGRMGRLGPLAHGTHVGRRTAAGRRMLDRLTAEPPEDPIATGTDAVRVALHGRAAMPDQGLCAAIFERPPAPPTVGGPDLVRRRRDVEYADPSHAAYRTGDAAGGAGMIGTFDSGGF